MQERRAYDRIKLVMPAQMGSKKVNEDTTCDIVDISEEGMRIRVASDVFMRLKIKRNDDITFHFIDRYQLGRDSIEDDIADTAKVVYIENGFGFHELGCYIKSSVYTNYVLRKKKAIELGE